MSQSLVQFNNFADQFDYSHVNGEIYEGNEQYPSPIIEGYFPKENIVKEMAIRKINTNLTVLLGVIIFFTAVSYYFATANEMVLNNLSRQTTVLNDENADLQNRVDRLKSFNNVDMTMQKNNMLKKAQQVMEIPAVSSNNVVDNKFDTQKPFAWAIGY